MKRLITAGLATAAIAGSLMGAGAANADVYYKNCSEARAAGGDTDLSGPAGLPARS